MRLSFEQDEGDIHVALKALSNKKYYHFRKISPVGIVTWVVSFDSPVDEVTDVSMVTLRPMLYND